MIRACRTGSRTFFEGGLGVVLRIARVGGVRYEKTGTEVQSERGHILLVFPPVIFGEWNLLFAFFPWTCSTSNVSFACFSCDDKTC